MPKNKSDRRSKTVNPLRYLDEDYIPGYFSYDTSAFPQENSFAFYREKCAHYVRLYGEKFSEPAIENPVVKIKNQIVWLVYMHGHSRWREDDKKIKTLANQMSILRYLQELPHYTSAEIENLCQQPYRHNYITDYGCEFREIFEYLNASQHYAETGEVPQRIERVLHIKRKNFSEEQTQAYFAFLREMTIDCIRGLTSHFLDHLERILALRVFAWIV